MESSRGMPEPTRNAKSAKSSTTIEESRVLHEPTGEGVYEFMTPTREEVQILPMPIGEGTYEIRGGDYCRTCCYYFIGVPDC